MIYKTLIGSAVVLGLLLPVTLAAQTTPKPDSSNSDVSKPETSASSGGESLSTKLSKTNGVITPKSDVDPGIAVGAPVAHPNSMPVIPPSATGGQTAK